MPDEPLYSADATWSDDAPAGRDVAPRPERYEVREVLGEGATGVVEAVYDRHLDRVVARKRPKGGSTFDEASFLREARLTARLQHPTVVRIYDAGVDEDGPFYTMELVDGQTLRHAWRGVPADRRMAFLPVLQAAAEGMASAHEQGVVHRDLKPANVMLGRLGRAWVVDFGLGRSTAEPTSHAVGTPRYMSPEQARGEATDPRSDVWSLGAMLYELLVGHPAYQGPTQEVLAALRAGRPPPPPPDDRPPELVAITSRAMHPDPQRRYVHAGELADDLAAFASGRAVSAYRYGAREAVARWARLHRHRLLLALLALLSLAGVGLAGAASQVRATLAERDRALAAEREARHALALSLEAQARQAVGRPEEAVPLARRALALDPGRPWARGVLAAHPDFATVSPSWTSPRQGCGESFAVGQELVLICGDTLVRLSKSGDELGAAPRPVGLTDQSGHLWRLDGMSLRPLRWTDGGLVDHGDPIRLDPSYPRRFGTDWADVPVAEISVDGVRLPRAGGAELHAGMPWSSIPYDLSCHRDGTCLVLGAEATWRCTERFTTCERWPVSSPALEAAWHPEHRWVLGILSDGRMVLDRGDGPDEVVHGPQAHALRQVAWSPRDDFVSLDVTGTVRHHDADGQVLATLDASDTAPRSLHVLDDVAVASGPHGHLAMVLDDRGHAHRMAVLPHGASTLVRDATGSGVWVGAVGKVWHVGPRGEVRDGGVHDVDALVVKDIAIDGDRLYLALNHLAQEAPARQHHHLTTARRVGRTAAHRWRATFGGSLEVDPPLDSVDPSTGQPWRSLGDLATGGDTVAFESSPGIVSVLGDDGRERYRSPPLSREAWAIALSRDGRVLAFADADHRIYRVEIATGAVHSWDSGHRAPIATLAVSDDGQRVLSGSWDATARVYDAEGRLLLGLEGHRGRIVGASFLDGGRAATASWDATVRFWNLSVIP